MRKEWLEIYRSAVLTVIAVLLLAIWIKIPVPYTVENVKSGKVKRADVPFVRIDGYVQVDIEQPVEIAGSVRIEDQPLEVEVLR